MPPDPKQPDPNAPAPTDPNAPDPAAPKFMTAEDFNGAMTARERRLEQRLAKQLEDFQKSITSKLTPAPADPSADDIDDPAAPAPVPGQPTAHATDKPSKDVLKLKDEVAKLRRERQREREEMERERQAQLLADANAKVQSALVEAGSSGPHTKAAWALLSAEGRIKRNEQGEVCIELQRTYLGKAENELVPLKEAIPEWLNSEAGKLFLPPRGGGEGSGTVVRGGAPRTAGKMSKEEAKREAQATLSKFVLGGG